MRPALDRIRGALYGVALGDAFGMPSEAFERDLIKKQFGKILTLLPGQDNNFISKGFKAGETTDDTAMSVVISDYLADSKLDPEPLELIRRIEAWAEATGKSAMVIGPSTRRAFDQIKNGVPVSEAGKTGTTNGASMKIAPVGLAIDYRNEERLLSMVERICMPTHYTHEAISAAAAVAAAVSYAARNETTEGLEKVAAHFADEGRKRGYAYIGAPSVGRRLELALEFSKKIDDDDAFLDTLYDVVGTGLPSVESVPSAIAIAVRAGKDVERAAILAANAGGDTDTMGAIACAISGAAAGISGIEKKFLDIILSLNEFDFETTAKRLYDVSE